MTTDIWITRTQPGADKSAVAWRAAGWTPHVAPLLTVRGIVPDRPISPASILVFTSANGIRHCPVRGDDRRVYCVGDATASAARAAGFVNIVTGSLDANSLADIIDYTTKIVSHISGSAIRGNLVERLRSRGMTAERHVVYKTEPVDTLPRVTPSSAVALYSPLAAKTFSRLAMQWDGPIICLSDAVACELTLQHDPQAVRIASVPTEAALIASARGRD